mmetsp:Transcript_7454/g.18479  ORF Transcript_7454/g.18479 Transcript_7454/m.18479 type:complete len:263 (-) Transcript_7454:785-1573(-)
MESHIAAKTSANSVPGGGPSPRISTPGRTSTPTATHVSPSSGSEKPTPLTATVELPQTFPLPTLRLAAGLTGREGQSTSSAQETSAKFAGIDSCACSNANSPYKFISPVIVGTIVTKMPGATTTLKTGPTRILTEALIKPTAFSNHHFLRIGVSICTVGFASGLSRISAVPPISYCTPNSAVQLAIHIDLPEALHDHRHTNQIETRSCDRLRCLGHQQLLRLPASPPRSDSQSRRRSDNTGQRQLDLQPVQLGGNLHSCLRT